MTATFISKNIAGTDSAWRVRAAAYMWLCLCSCSSDPGAPSLMMAGRLSVEAAGSGSSSQGRAPSAATGNASGVSGVGDRAGASAGGGSGETSRLSPVSDGAAGAAASSGSMMAGVGSIRGTPLDTNRLLDGARAVWKYTEFPDTQCRDGSASGVAINLGDTSKVLIYLEGGNLCFNDQTCDFSPSSVDVSGLGTTVGAGGMFDRSRAENPFRDWSFVYIPYCTGDFHIGNNPDAMVPNVGPQKFMGRANMEKFLARVVPTFSGATDVVLSGSSAGGFGALFNTLLVQRAFPDVKVKMLDDSGPPVSKALAAPCLQDTMRTLWKIDQTILTECGSACPNPHDYIQDYAVFVAKALSDRPLALISSAEDFGQRSAFAVAKNDCTGSLVAAFVGGILDVGDGVSASDWRAELQAIRDRMKPYTNFNTFYPESALHTWISGYSEPEIIGDYYEAEVGGVKLTDWLATFAGNVNPGQEP